jgi:hypothetical protein
MSNGMRNENLLSSKSLESILHCSSVSDIGGVKPLQKNLYLSLRILWALRGFLEQERLWNPPFSSVFSLPL